MCERVCTASMEAMTKTPRTSAPHRSLIQAALPYAQAAGEIFAEALWPTRCAVCDAPGASLCGPCERALAYIDWNRACPRCGAPFGCVQCCECNTVMLAAAGRERPPYERLASAVSFDEDARRIVSAFKDGGERRLALDMAAIMARCIPPDWAAAGPCVTFVPASTAALRRRGFDHVELLSEEIAQEARLSHLPLLARPRSLDQRQLTRAERFANMGGCLGVLEGAAAPNEVIVVDDVCTTGATLFAACDALREAGAQRIFCLTFARV